MNTPLRALVTGSTHGIGQAIADCLRERGDTVVGIDLEGDDHTIIADLGAPTERVRGFDEALARLGGLDVLINVAGIWAAGAVDSSLPADWQRLWSLNMEAPIDLMRLASEPMAAQQFGRIVTVTSVHARVTQRSSLAYSVAKAGLEAATRAAALDLADHGILVNGVAPGFVRTRMSVLEDGVDETTTAAFRSVYVEGGRIPLRRAADPNEIAPAVAFLASQANTYITGAVLTVDGGLSATF